MPMFEDDLPPGKQILSESDPRRVSLTDKLLAAIADELHQINQHIEYRNL
ncbi:hypothetical protein [Corynebacterium sp. HMSC11D10]|nr:hypothetical protein [Corynebacterium sp. HMSC11D10]